MNLTLVIPTHNRNNDVASLVESITAQCLGDLKIEVLIISNLKNESLENWVKSNSQKAFSLSYFEVGKIGVNAARNLGIQMSKSEKIYFLDDDVILQNPNHLKNIFEIAMQNPAIAAIGGSYTLPQNASSLDRSYHHICTAWLKEGESHLVGGNTLYNYALLKDHLHFNEEIIFGGSETELNLILHFAGYNFLFLESLNVEHRSNLTYISLIKKAIRQGMGRSFHENITPPAFWKTDKEQAKNSIYDFFFHVGYRHGKKTNNQTLSKKVLWVCIVETFFQIGADETLNLPNPTATPFHLQNYPKLKFRELHHWLKANTWWKIPNYLFWKIIPFIGNIVICSVGAFFPFEPQGLRTFYYRTFYRIEKTIQGNN